MTYADGKYVAAVGSRKLPARLRPKLAKVATQLEQLGYILRSGGAEGSDSAFESGLAWPERAEIYLPKQGWRGHPSPLFDALPEAYTLAEQYHPAWHRCSAFTRDCHARSMHQVLGRDLATAADFIVCWTPGAMDVGGTAQALRVARRLGIDVFNLADPHAELALWRRVG